MKKKHKSTHSSISLDKHNNLNLNKYNYFVLPNYPLLPFLPEREKEMRNTDTQTKNQQEIINIETQLKNYQENMKPDKYINPSEGGKWQYNLYNIFKSTLNISEQSDFNNAYTAILNFFNKNKNDIFNYHFILRFSEHFPGTDKEFNILRNMVVLAIETCDPKTRKINASIINLDKATENLTESEKQKLINFYSY